MEELPIEATVYSMSANPPAEPDRRADERHLTLFRVGALMVHGRRELCLVKNVSAGGALVRTYCAMEPGCPVQVELKEGQLLAGRVGWVRGTDVGIEFDRPVDVLDLLKTSGDGPRPRMPRVEVSCGAFVREGAVVNRVLLQNVSQGGINIESPNPLTVGADVTATLPGLAPQGAVVRWKQGNRYGVAFNNVLPLAGLVEWLHSRQAN